MFWSSSCNFTDGDITVQLVVSVSRSKREAMTQCAKIYTLTWGSYGRILVSSDSGNLLADAVEVTVRNTASGSVFTGQEAIAFLSTHEGFPQAFNQSNCATSPYLGNKYPLE